jgi:uncharacterized protein (DUF849 family)
LKVTIRDNEQGLDMKKSRAAIISCAVTGAVHTPSMSDALPITPDEIAAEGIAAWEAGAAVLHLHARDPRTGAPTPDPAVFEQFLPRITGETDAIINITTGGSTAMTIEERLEAPMKIRPEMASLNMGSMNFVFSAAARRSGDWKYSWEKDYLLGSEGRIFSNTFQQIEYTLRELGEGRGTRFEFECYDVGHLYTLAHFRDRGLVPAPMLVQCIFGVLGGIGADAENFSHMVATADRLFGDDYMLSAFAAGKNQMSFVTQSALVGGHVRVGLEDSLYLERGRMAASNAEQVAKAVRILSELGREPASPAEARKLLSLPAA